MARWLLLATVVVDVLAVVIDVRRSDLLARFAAGEQVPPAEASANDTTFAVVGGLQTLLLLFAGAAFIRWLSLAYRNLPALGVRRLRHKSWWAIGGWFIPIANVFRPKQIVNDVWRGSDPAAPPRSEPEWVRRPVPRLFAGWWAMWLVSSVAGYVAAQASLGSSMDMAVLGAVNMAYVFSDLTSIIAGVLAIDVVGRVTARQEERARLLAA